MAGYDPNLDFFGLLRPSVGSQLVRRMPILDTIIKTLGDANLIPVWVGYTAPTTAQNTTAWLLPQSPSWQGPGLVMLWDQTQNQGAGNYVPATPALFAALLNQLGAITTESQGPPNAQVGVPGSVYFQTDTGQIWYKNQQGAWVLFPVTGAGGGDGGFLNRFRNGTQDVWSRFTGAALTIPTSGAFASDSWFVWPFGGGVTATRAPGRLLTRFSLQINGASGANTDTVVRQRITSLDAAPMSSRACTVQAQIFASIGAPIIPKLTIRHPTSPDNFASGMVVDVNAVPLQSCPDGTWTQVGYTFQASPQTVNGLEVNFDLGPGITASNTLVQITELDIRATPGMPIGLNASPPSPELRSAAMENLQCQRYFWRWQPTAAGRIESENLSPNQCTVNFGIFAVQMRQAPTVTDNNLSDLLAYDLVTGQSGAVGSSAFSAFSAQGYGYVNYAGVAGSPLIIGHPGAVISHTGIYSIDFNAEP